MAPTSATHRGAEEIGRTALGVRPLPELGHQRAAADLAHVDTVLGNGLRVLAVRKANVPMVELRLAIPFAGDDPMHPATAEVLAETIATGTARRDRVAIDTELALIGGDLGTSVDPEHLTVSAGSLAAGLPTLLDVLSDVLTNASYVDGEVARESARIVERLAVARTQPRVIAREALQRRRYGNHPCTREMPQPEDVAKVTPGAVKALHAASVLPRGSVLVLVGDIDPDGVVGQVENALREWHSDRSAAVLAPLPDLAPGDLLLVPRAGAVQSQLRLSAQALSRTDPRYPALQLANLAYGGYFSSRLVENIREDKGYTYSAHSGFEFTGDKATVQVDADTANEVTAAALLETRYELGRLGLVPPSGADVDSVRQYAVGSLLIASSAQAGLAAQLTALAVVGLGAEWLAEHPRRLAAVTTEDVAQAALDFFAPSRFTGVVVGDADTLAPQLTALGGVTVEATDS
ncbi:peptidase M16 [Prauserella marina]|uniref:Predicted Zn-dependent peptidase n=1 Tax=Prauserella marina TaxID=530584 RepID=A0A222VKL8_9PSEU|nr:pitrilysin family protein [Prauserella marina]ASR34362.1 peptidase M16 [Prauserella marina]PWV71846.1 putative Zn-dependent peptidase [Prauserella marina]SDD89200.1 Predicted Zn-dependent peptidase [Prauserella marina]